MKRAHSPSKYTVYFFVPTFSFPLFVSHQDVAGEHKEVGGDFRKELQGRMHPCPTCALAGQVKWTEVMSKRSTWKWSFSRIESPTRLATSSWAGVVIDSEETTANGGIYCTNQRQRCGLCY